MVRQLLNDTLLVLTVQMLQAAALLDIRERKICRSSLMLRVLGQSLAVSLVNAIRDRCNE
jgi:hypothetical protein